MLGATTILLEDKHLYNTPSSSGIDLTVNLKDLCLGTDICGADEQARPGNSALCHEGGALGRRKTPPGYFTSYPNAARVECCADSQIRRRTRRRGPPGVPPQRSSKDGSVTGCLKENLVPLNEQAICAPRPYFFGAGGSGLQMYPQSRNTPYVDKIFF